MKGSVSIETVVLRGLGVGVGEGYIRGGYKGGFWLRQRRRRKRRLKSEFSLQDVCHMILV